ncbi:PA0069 family radical SAM protein [Rhodovulum strictum]|uniref:PA0069 family radical SAM protein n=1 Tax=Rhodovulum strictum TaxID=58314 RepID=A0A844BMD5_9RHOB|nr:PA0069 family radical SAM protein [Rhodovulum strictum]MRH21147.1 PA0069 family radical SAM protein [Rhodovulum strictum]
MDRPLARCPGRGASSNPANRFDRLSAERIEDGWAPEADLPVLRTDIRVERPRRVITRNASPDVPFDRSINPYRGCEHGCIYCFARPGHAYLGLSPGLDFETRLIARPGAPELLARELSAPSYRPRTIAIGTYTDPYQPVEADHQIMRRLLEVLLEFRHPVGIVTRGTLIERDLDLLSDLAGLGLVRVGVSLTTLDARLARAMEPRAPAPQRRLQTIARLAAAGVEVRAMLAPVILGLTDHEIEALLARAAEAGAIAASWAMLRLPLEVSGLFRDWLAQHCPDRAGRVMAQLREMHGGRDYSPDWGRRMRGEGPHAAMIARRFRVMAARLGLDRDLPGLRSDLFRLPPRPGQQLSLF